MNKILTAREIFNQTAEESFPLAFQERQLNRSKIIPLKTMMIDSVKIKIEVVRDDDVVILRIEPFTLAWFTLQIAEGVLAYIGTKVAYQLFNGHSGPVELQESSIRRLSEAFAIVLQAERLQQASDKLRSIQQSIVEYNNAPTTSAYRLDSAILESVNLCWTLSSLSWIALPSYLLASTIRLSLLQQRFLVSNDNGELISLLQQIKISVEQSANAYFEGLRIYNSFFTGIAQNPYLIIGSPYVWGYYFKGTWISVGNYNQAVAAVQKAKADYYNKELDPIVINYSAIRAQWEEIRKVTKNKLIEAGITVTLDL